MATNPDHRRRAGHSEAVSARPGGAGPHGGGGRGRSDRAAALRRAPYHVILTDIYMPQMDGIELIMRVKEAFPEARIVAMSGGGGLAKENVLGAAAKLGAEVVLEKPFQCGPGGRGHRGGDEGVLIAMRRPTAALLLLALAACGRAPEPAVRSVTLDRGWRFHGTADSTWLLASVRGTVHTDLLDAGRIRDPLTGDRERELRWIEDEAWTYRLDFDVDDETLREERVDLVFESLDTWASVTLNGHPLTLELRWVRRMMSCHRGPLLSASLLRCPRNRVNSRSYPT